MRKITVILLTTLLATAVFAKPVDPQNISKNNADLEKNKMKKQCVIDSGYNFIFIIDKIYEDFIALIE